MTRRLTKRLTKRLTGWQKWLRVERDSLVVSGTTKTTRTTGAAGTTRATGAVGRTMALTFLFLFLFTLLVNCFFVKVAVVKFN